MSNCTGTDISKNTYDVHFLSSGADHRFDCNPENIAETVSMFRSADPDLTVMEAAGGYESDPATELQAAGLPAAAVNPKKIRDFAKAPGQTAKTDRIDARATARFGAALQPPASEAADETTRKIKSPDRPEAPTDNCPDCRKKPHGAHPG